MQRSTFRFLCLFGLLLGHLKAAPAISWSPAPPYFVQIGSPYQVGVRVESAVDTNVTASFYQNGSYFGSEWGCAYQSGAQIDYPVLSTSLTEYSAQLVNVSVEVCEEGSEDVVTIASTVDAYSNAVLWNGAWEECNTVNDPNVAIIARPGEAFPLQGWAFDQQSGTTGMQVRLLLDGLPVPAAVNLGLARQDIANAKNRQDWIACGWKAWWVVPPASANNWRWLEVRAVNPVGTETRLGIRSLLIVPNAPTPALLSPKEGISLSQGQTSYLHGRVADASSMQKYERLQVRDPNGVWSHLTTAAWSQVPLLAQALTATGSERAGGFTFDRTGTWMVRMAVSDVLGSYWRYANFQGVPITVSSHAAPVATFSMGSNSGTSPLTVAFDASASTGASLTYEWDFNNDGVYDYVSSSPTTSFTFYADSIWGQAYYVKLRVTDSSGVSALSSLQSIGVNAPTPLTVYNGSGSLPEGSPFDYTFTLSGFTSVKLSGGALLLHGGNQITPSFYQGNGIVYYNCLPAGTYTARVWGSGNDQYDDDGNIVGTEYVGNYNLGILKLPCRTPQTISGFAASDPLPPGTIDSQGNRTIMLPATCSSGEAPAYTVFSGPARVSGNSLMVLGYGPVVVRAGQIGNAIYAPAQPVERAIDNSDTLPQGNVVSLNGRTHPSEVLSLIPGESLTLAGTASDSGCFGLAATAPVKIYINGIYRGPATLGANAAWTYTEAIAANAAPGVRVIEARVVDVRGTEIALLPARVFVVGQVPPEVVLDRPVFPLAIAPNTTLRLSSEAVGLVRGLIYHGFEVVPPAGATLTFATLVPDRNAVSSLNQDYTFSAVGEYRVYCYVDDGLFRSYDPMPGLLVRVVAEDKPAPRDLAVVATTSTTIRLIWSATAQGNALTASPVKYDVYRNNQKVNEVDLFTPYFVDRLLTPTTTYTYTVKAIYPGVGESAPSSPITGSTLSGTDTDADGLIDRIEDRLGTPKATSNTIDTTGGSVELKIHNPN